VAKNLSIRKQRYADHFAQRDILRGIADEEISSVTAITAAG
jgi:hypothetical protein